MSFDVNSEEWRELRAEVRDLVEETRRLEKLAVGATGAVYAWLASNFSSTANLWGSIPWYIPVLFAGFGAWRCWALSSHIGVAAEYLRRLEDALSSDRSPGLGWERYFENHRGPTHGSAVYFWGVFVLLTLTVPIVVTEFVFKCS